MEPALRRRMFACPEWKQFVVLYYAARRSPNGPLLLFHVHGHAVEVGAVQRTNSRFPPAMLYLVDGVRLTPAVFGDTINRIMDLEARGVATLPVRKGAAL